MNLKGMRVIWELHENSSIEKAKFIHLIDLTIRAVVKKNDKWKKKDVKIIMYNNKIDIKVCVG